MHSQAATPLIALDAIVLDTETTGLDPTRARIVQIGAVAIREGRLVPDERFDRLVDPGMPIPPASTAIHGIDDATVAGKGAFLAAYDDFEVFRRGRLVVGHNLGFDLALLKRECQLAGRTFEPPPSLDTRLLGEVCFPSLPDQTLEVLSERLGLALDRSQRHDAVADAIAAGALFVALMPVLKDRGIRTVAEADEACRQLAGALEGFVRAGWVEPRALADRAAQAAALARIDAFPFRHRAHELMARPPVAVPPDLTVAELVRLMMDRRISSVFVADGGELRAADSGIVTERDVMRAIAAGGGAALALPAAAIASRPLATVEAEDFAYRAIGRMNRLKVRHLGVADADGRLVGALSARDLLRARASDALMLGDAVEAADSPAALAAAFARMPVVARQLVQEDVPAREVAAVISHEIAALTGRAARLAEARMAEEGHGPPPVAYAVLVLGSVGRGESLLAADQDNAVVTAVPPDPDAADRWFARFGGHLADALDAAGVAYCKGGVMAKNPAFRGSIDDWRARISAWLGRNRPEDLLAVDIFYDFRPVHGDMELAARLFDDAYEAAHRAPVLAMLLAGQIEGHRPPLTLLGGFRTEQGRVDLKKGGLFPVVAAARCLAMRHDIRLRGTRERLEAVRRLQIGSDADLARWTEAHAVILDAILRQQLADIAAGRPPGNRVDPAILGRDGQRRLKEALTALGTVATTVRDLLFRG